MKRASMPALALLVLALLTACGGDGPRDSADRATSTPDETGISRTTVEPELASSAGRSDCLEDWLVYREDYVSICYPPDHYAEVWSREADSHFSVRLSPGEPVAYTPWSLSLEFDRFEPPETCFFRAERTAVPDEQELGQVRLGRLNGWACTARLGAVTQFYGAALLLPGGVQFELQAETQEQFDLAKQILATLIDERPLPTFQPITPTATPLIAGPDVRPCTASDITASPWPASPETQHVAFGIALANQSDTPCRISHQPALQFVASDGEPVSFDVGQCRWECFDQPALLLPNRAVSESQLSLRMGQVLLTLTWMTHDGSGLCQFPPPRATRILVLLPDTHEHISSDVTEMTRGYLDEIAPCGGAVSVRSYQVGLAP